MQVGVLRLSGRSALFFRVVGSVRIRPVQSSWTVSIVLLLCCSLSWVQVVIIAIIVLSVAVMIVTVEAWVDDLTWFEGGHGIGRWKMRLSWARAHVMPFEN